MRHLSRNYKNTNISLVRDPFRRYLFRLKASLLPVSEPTVSPIGLVWRKLANPSGTLRAMLMGFATVAGLTLLTKAFSFFKDAVVAHHFGVTHALDGFLLAFGLHTFIAGMLASGLPAAMLPAFSDVRHRLGDDAANRLALQSAIVHAITLGVIGIIVDLFGDFIVNLMGKGFEPSIRAMSRHLLLDLLPFLFCYGMTTHLGSWLRGRKSFVAATASPIITPLVIMLILLWPGQTHSIHLLVLATNIGAALHLMIVVLAVGRHLPGVGRGWWRSLRQWEPENTTILKSAGPFLIAGLVLGATTLVDTTMAGWLEAGSVTVLSYSDKVCTILLSITAMAASEALFPFFADLVAQRNWDRLRRQMEHTLIIVGVIAVPLTLLLAWQADFIVAVLFQRGQFTAEDTHRVADVLRFAALQIPFYITGVLLSRIVVSLQAGWFTLALATLSLLINIGLNAFFMRTMGVSGIALSTACVYLFTSVALYLYVFRAIRRLHQAESLSSP